MTAHPADPTHVLDDVVRAALLGPHAHLAERRGRVLRYPVDVCPFLAFPDDPGDADWRDLAQLAGPGEVTGLAAAAVPDGWEVLFTLDGVQMVDDGIPAAPDPEAVVLGPADVPEMLALVERTRPGPFRPRTIAMGTYLGVRRGGRLIAMAGERLHPPGWTEISAVCTDAEHRGEGLATRLVSGGRGGHPRARRHPVPARLGGQRQRDPPLHGARVPAAADAAVRGRADPPRRRGSRHRRRVSSTAAAAAARPRRVARSSECRLLHPPPPGPERPMPIGRLDLRGEPGPMMWAFRRRTRSRHRSQGRCR